MEPADIQRVGVVGAGTMGSGIAQVAAAAGHDVVLQDVDRAALERGVDSVESGLARDDDVGPGEAETVRDRISTTTEMEQLAGTDLVVEAVVERLDIKQEVFDSLDRLCDDETVLGTNTSTLSITTVAAATERPSQVVGVHFMNPVPVMPGVEVVVGEHTAPETTGLAHRFAEGLGKTTWESADKPGFVVNRVLMPWINEGIRAYDEGVASKSDIDAGLRLGTNAPMGPLELADHIGLDVALHATETLHEELGDRYRPAYLLKRKVEAGDLGKKTGRGFYEYEN